MHLGGGSGAERACAREAPAFQKLGLSFFGSLMNGDICQLMVKSLHMKRHLRGSHR